jgi:acetyl esterase/lipase
MTSPVNFDRYFGISAVIAAASLLTVFRAPAKPLWYLALVVTEWGHWFALFLIIVLTITPLRMRLGRGGASLIAISALLCLTPLWRAQAVAARLPGDLNTAFGPSIARETPDAPSRSTPLSFRLLWSGIFSPAVEKTTHVFETIDGQSLSLNLFRPLQITTPLPGILIIHGGSWQSGDREEFEALNRYLAARGYAVAVMDYRLAPRWTFPAPREDAYTALRWLKDHAQKFQLSNQWVIAGRSAGGQIALATAYRRHDPAIRGVIVLYSPNDLAFAYSIPANPLIMNSQRVISVYMGGTPEQKPDLYNEASPLTAVDAQTPPTLMIHGLRDELVWPVHEERLSARMAAAARPYYFLKLPWATHGCDINLSGPAGQLSTFAIERFLAAVLPAAPKGATHV